MSKLLIALTTLPSADAAATLSRTLVEEELAACVSIVPGVRSIYRWQGKLCDEAEVLCLIKTRPALAQALRERIVALHPYEVPEVAILEVGQVYADYLAWVEASTRKD